MSAKSLRELLAEHDAKAEKATDGPWTLGGMAYGKFKGALVDSSEDGRYLAEFIDWPDWADTAAHVIANDPTVTRAFVAVAKAACDHSRSATSPDPDEWGETLERMDAALLALRAALERGKA